MTPGHFIGIFDVEQVFKYQHMGSGDADPKCLNSGQLELILKY